MDQKDPTQESPEAKKARLESEAQVASDNYQEKSKSSENKFGERVKGLLGGKNVAKTVVLETLDLAPFLAGYSLADLWVAGEGVIDVAKGIMDKDKTRTFKGLVKLGVAGMPGIPVAGISPSLDELLPNEEKKKEAVNVTSNSQNG